MRVVAKDRDGFLGCGAKVPQQTRPNPGSKEALTQGCKCPVLDNGHGKGRGDGNFWITSNCPVHALGEVK